MGVSGRKARNWRMVPRVLLSLFFLYALVAALPYAPRKAVRLPESGWQTDCATAWGVDEGRLIQTGPESLALRLRLIGDAREEILIGTYMLRPDGSGNAVMAALMDAADRGVRVKILMDGFIGMINAKNDIAFYLLGSHPNAEIRMYNLVNFLNPVAINACYHEKYMVVDREWLMLGGRNISDEFLDDTVDTYSNDLEILLHRTQAGVCAADRAAERFEMMWALPWVRQAFGTFPDIRKGEEEERLQAWEKLMDDSADRQAELPTDFVPIDQTLLLGSAVDEYAKEPVLYQQMMELAMEAEESVILLSPYFTLDRFMKQSLQDLYEDTPELLIVTNSMAMGNNIITMAENVICGTPANTLKGAVFESQMAQSLHTKAMLLDGAVTLIGSFNFDMRSAYIDTEIMLYLRSDALCHAMMAYGDGLIAESYAANEEAKATGLGQSVAAAVPFGKRMITLILSPLAALFRFLI